MTSSLVVKNPYNDETIRELSFATNEKIASQLLKSRHAFEKWRTSPAWRRAELLNQAAAKLESQAEDFAQLMVMEAGKPITYARVEVARALGVLRWAAAETLRFSGELLRLDTVASGREGFGIHQKFPRGVILGITPFNFPLNLVIHKVAPAIACGCAIVIKPSPSTPLTALKMAELFSDEPELVQVILADDEGTQALTRAQEIAMISFTGSAKIGFQIRTQSPKKPAVLELGGNAWVAVLDDISEKDFQKIATRIANAAFSYAGQSCISVQNVAVAQSHYKKFSEALTQATKKTIYGDPSDQNTISGPVIRARDAERIRGALTSHSALKIESRSSRGTTDLATLVPPTLVCVDATDRSALTEEEIFGPVMTLRPFSNTTHLIALVNSSKYGLQAGIYSQNLAAIQTLYRDLEVGGVVVNDAPTSRYDHQPYGGKKQSGQGREGVRYAMEEMCESKFLALSSEIPG